MSALNRLKAVQMVLMNSVVRYAADLISVRLQHKQNPRLAGVFRRTSVSL